MAKKRPRPPEVLRRVFGDKVRSLGETLLAMLPNPLPPRQKCRCRGTGCLGCRGSPFLLRRDDGFDYRQLLNRCFCVMSAEASEPADFHYNGERSQRLIVRSTVELLMGGPQPYKNVLCEGYNQSQRRCFSHNGELLCTPTWSLLLTRIGESVMVHLLKFSSIFIPLPASNHYQVTGPSLLCNPVLSNQSIGTSAISGNQQALQTGDNDSCECRLKRKRAKFEEKQQEHSNSHNFYNEPPLVHYCTSSVSSLIHDGLQKHVWSLDCRSKKGSCVSITEASIPKDSFNNDMCKESSSVVLSDNHESVIPIVSNSAPDFPVKSRKRGRLFKWQRHRKWKKLSTSDDDPNGYSSILSDKECSSRMLDNMSVNNLQCKSARVRKIVHTEGNQISVVNQYPPISLEDNALQEKIMNVEATEKTSVCFHCLMIQSPPEVCRRAEIKKTHMFYNSNSSSSIFPRDHIINRLKANSSGAHALLSLIFDIPKGNLNANQTSCFHDNPATKSGCLYYSLLRNMKTLIRNARKCNHMKFLRRHCSVPTKGCHHVIANKAEAAERSPKDQGKENRLQKSSEKPLSDISSWNMDINKQKAVHTKCSMAHNFQSDQSGPYCEHEKVVSFLWAVTRNIVPVNLLGSPSNWRSLRRNIAKFVSLQRFEKFYLRQCTSKFQICGMSFLSCLSNHHTCHCTGYDGSSKIEGTSKYKNRPLILKHKLIQRWIYWFFSDMIVPILSTNFYITETESGRHEVFYYPKPVWCKLVQRTKTILKKHNYSHVDYKTFEKIINRRSFGFSKVRFLPKGKEMRLLANLKAPSKAWLHTKSSHGQFAKPGQRAGVHLKLQNNTGAKLVHLKSVNTALYDMHAILKRIRTECPQMLGASVFDYNDTYQMLCEFLSKLRNGSTAIPEVFIVVCDVSKAFDSIVQERLLDVMKHVIQKEDYHIRKYAQIICSREFMRILYGSVCVDQGKAYDTMNPITSIRSRSSHGVLVGQHVARRIKLVEIHRLLDEHVRSNMLQVGQDLFLQKSGIAQGSLLSSLLCSFYYGHMERTVIFPFLGKICDSSSSKDNKELSQADYGYGNVSLLKESKTHPTGLTMGLLKEDEKLQGDAFERKKGSTHNPSPNYLLLRLIDDFIFISTSKRQATCFFNRLRRGFREYNCYMNTEKFGLSFDVDGQPQVIANRRYVGVDGISFLPWSGLLVNCCTLEVQADYTRYLGTHLRCTLTVNAQAKPEHLGEKLCSYMRPKCHPIFYDSYINSPATVRLNLYQAFLLCAMKFHCYLCAITPDVRDIRPVFCLNIIQKSFRYMYRLIKKRIYGMERRASGIRAVLMLKKPEAIWLGLSAYIRVLGRKQSRHAELLSLLKADFCNLGKINCDPSPLKYAVDDSHSSMFWKIKY